MAGSDTAFTGAVPELYTRCMGPVFFMPYAEDLARRAAGMTQGSILETACGTGIVTRALARVLPEAVSITATDLKRPMIDHARVLPGGERVRWGQVDAQALPFAEASFDIALCSFGVMFFPDKPRAYREVLRVLRPGGRFIFTVWDRLETIELQCLAHMAVAALYPRDPPDFLRRTPCGYHDISVIRADLARSGFAEAAIETLDLPSRAASAREVAVGLVKGTPLSAEIAARDPAGLDGAVEASVKAIAARFGEGPIEARMRAHVVTAQRPAAPLPDQSSSP